MSRLMIIAVFFTVVPQATGRCGGAARLCCTPFAPILKKYSGGCKHNDEDREGKFSLESYESLQRGTAHGPALLPGDAKGSRIVRLLTGAAKPLCLPRKIRCRP